MKIKENIEIGNTGYTLEDLTNNHGTILWTNPSPSSEFASQNMNFGDTFSYYDIIFIQDGLIFKCQRCYVDFNINYLLENNLGGYIRTREVRVYDSSMYFAAGYFYGNYNSGTANNYQCIPYQIIGYK